MKQFKQSQVIYFTLFLLALALLGSIYSPKVVVGILGPFCVLAFCLSPYLIFRAWKGYAKSWRSKAAFYLLLLYFLVGSGIVYILWDKLMTI